MDHPGTRSLLQKLDIVHGFDPDSKQKIDPGPFTARGVFAGMSAAAGELFENGLAGRSVLVQGVGHVGERLAELVRQADGNVLVSDIDAITGKVWSAKFRGRK